MVKCDICHETIETTFLNKIKGTIMKIGKKQKYVCSDCQRKYKKEDIVKQLS